MKISFEKKWPRNIISLFTIILFTETKWTFKKMPFLYQNSIICGIIPFIEVKIDVSVVSSINNYTCQCQKITVSLTNFIDCELDKCYEFIYTFEKCIPTYQKWPTPHLLRSIVFVRPQTGKQTVIIHLVSCVISKLHVSSPWKHSPIRFGSEWNVNHLSSTQSGQTPFTLIALQKDVVHLNMLESDFV